MSRWQEATPGIERAKCVQRPMPSMRPLKYAKLPVFTRAGLPHFSIKLDPLLRLQHAHEFEAIQYLDARPDHRIISASRVERAVETQAFLDICDDEELWIGRSGGKWQVLTGDTATDGEEAQSLRGAYLSYHARKEAVA